MAPQPPRSNKTADYQAWRDACAWVADSANIPPHARFITPRLAQTFGWYTGRSSVVNWKDVPQDAESIVRWRNRIYDIYSTGKQWPELRWYESLGQRSAASLRQLGAKYQADYLITERTDPPLDLDKVYDNDTYIIYRLR